MMRLGRRFAGELLIAIGVVLAVVAPLGYAMTGATGLTWAVPGAVVWPAIFAVAALREKRSVLGWALAGGVICGLVWALGEIVANTLAFAGWSLWASVPVSAVGGGLGGGALVGAGFGGGTSARDERRLTLASLALGGGFGASAGWYFALGAAAEESAVVQALVLVVGAVGGLATSLPGRALGRWFRPAVLFFDELWPYLREMAVPLAAFGAGYVCITLAFAGLYGTVWRLDHGAFGGLPSSPAFWDFVFYSLMTASTANTTVTAVSPTAQVLVAVEVTIGLGWLIVVFGALSAHLAPRLASIAEELHSRSRRGSHSPSE